VCILFGSTRCCPHCRCETRSHTETKQWRHAAHHMSSITCTAWEIVQKRTARSRRRLMTATAARPHTCNTHTGSYSSTQLPCVMRVRSALAVCSGRVQMCDSHANALQRVVLRALRRDLRYRGDGDVRRGLRRVHDLCGGEHAAAAAGGGEENVRG
jgi:hypothetical protein